jgi:uncharacterized coiled-coil protein SlyX
MNETTWAALVAGMVVAVAELIKLIVVRRLPRVADPLKPGDAVAGFHVLVGQLQVEIKRLEELAVRQAVTINRQEGVITKQEDVITRQEGTIARQEATIARLESTVARLEGRTA